MFIISLSVSAEITVTGTITDATSGEVLIGVSVFTSSRKAGTVSNAYGYFSLKLPSPDSVYFTYLGYETVGVFVKEESEYTIKLKSTIKQLQTVEIKAGDINKVKPSVITLDLRLLNELPTVGGERDLIKAVQLLPGVKKGADGTASMLVRGGTNDQNLILLDDAPVYNPTHLLGIFSLFNTDVIKHATFQTGGFSSMYGGRLSSVLDVYMNEGNTDKLKVRGGIGVLASRLAIDGPISKNRGTFLVAGRYSYVNRVFEMMNKSLPFYFYDFNAKVNLRLTDNDQLLLSIYEGDDVLNTNDKDSLFNVNLNSRMGNGIRSIRWNHKFKNRAMFANLTAFNSKYRYIIQGGFNKNTVEVSSAINDYGLKYVLNHSVNSKLFMKYGADVIMHQFKPNSTKLSGEFNNVLRNRNDTTQYLYESALFIHQMYRINQRLTLHSGLRFSGAKYYGGNQWNIEPRLLMVYQYSSKATLQIGYARMAQYMFQLSGSSTILPTDLWYGVQQNIKAPTADVFTVSYEYAWQHHQTKIEGYYKPMQNQIEYKEGVVDFTPADLAATITQGKGVAYGIELTQKGTHQQFSYLLGYSLSWSYRRFDELNNGNIFLTRFDRRHDLNLVLQYEALKRLQISAVWNYASGSRFTPVIGRFMMPSGNLNSVDVLPIYGGRNSSQLAAINRLDINMSLKSKASNKFQSEWQIGAYNVFNRTQPFRVRMENRSNGQIAYKQVGLFGFIPYVSYQFQF